MASFNQSPLGQTSLALGGYFLSIGSQTGSPAIAVNLDKQIVAGEASSSKKVTLAEEPVVYPGWRRELRK